MILQNTKEWLEYRHTRIGASDAAVIMGVSRFKTPLELWEEKTNKEPPKNKNDFILQKGHNLEKIARANYELETFLNWGPKIVEHSDNKRLCASLDGWNEAKKAVWECKYLSAEKYRDLKENSKIPDEYYPQIMHQVMITDAKEIHFTGIVDNKVNKNLGKDETEQHTIIIPINDEHKKYIKEKLLPEVIKFLYLIDNKIKPHINKDDILVIKNDELLNLLNKYKEIKELKDKYKKEEDRLKNEIFNISSNIHNKIKCNNYKITETIIEDKIIPNYEAFAKHKTKYTDKQIIQSGYSKLIDSKKIRKITYGKL